MASLIGWLKYSGARKVDGTPVASGRAYFYQPGTVSTQVTVYSDKDGLVALAQPVALDAAGRATVYTKVACKVEVQQAVDFAVVAVEDRANTLNAKHVEVENANYLGENLSGGGTVLGGRTDLDTVLSGLVGTGGGASGTYKENAAATQRTFQAAIGDHVTFQDYGAVGDGVTDDTTALNGAIARALAANKPLWIEPGTYNFVGPLSITLATAAGLRIMGANRAACILRNTSGTGNAITVDLGSAMESDIEMSDFSITNSGTSTGKGIEFLNGNGPSLRRISIANHRMGVDLSAISHGHVEDCNVSSTDGTASGRGFRLGAACVARNCRAAAATGKAFVVEGARAMLAFCRATAGATGFEFNASGLAHYCQSVGLATGFTMLASDAVCETCVATGATTGFNVGAVSRSGCLGCVSTGGTSDFTTNAAAASPVDVGNVFTTRNQGEGHGHEWMATRPAVMRKHVQAFSNTSPVSYTPDITRPVRVHAAVVQHTAAAGNITVTVNNTATAGLFDGQVLILVLESDINGGFNLIPAWGSQYRNCSTANMSAAATRTLMFAWRAANSSWVCFSEVTLTANSATGRPHWSS